MKRTIILLISLLALPSLFLLNTCKTETKTVTKTETVTQTEYVHLEDCELVCNKLIVCAEGFVGGGSGGFFGPNEVATETACTRYSDPDAAVCSTGWTCYADFYDTDYSCDCGCGIPDPDCALVTGCNTPFCSAPSCDSCADENGEMISCPPIFTWESGNGFNVRCANPPNCQAAPLHQDWVDQCIQGCMADAVKNAVQVNCLKNNICPDLLKNCINVMWAIGTSGT